MVHRILACLGLKYRTRMKRKPFKSWKAFLFLATVAMFCVGTVHTGALIHEITTSVNFVNGMGFYEHPPSSMYKYSKTTLEVVNVLSLSIAFAIRFDIVSVPHR